MRFIYDYETLIDKLTEYYKNEVDSLTPVIKKYNKFYYTIMIVYLISSFTALFCFGNLSKNVPLFIISLSLCILVWPVFFGLLRRQNKKRNFVLQEKYGFRVSKLEKVNVIARYVEYFRLNLYLAENVLQGRKKADYIGILHKICDKLNLQLDKKISEKFFIPGVFAALFIPAWIEFIKVWFKDINSINTAIQSLLTLLIFVLFIVFGIGLFRRIWSDSRVIFESDNKKQIRKLKEQIKKIADNYTLEE